MGSEALKVAEKQLINPTLTPSIDTLADAVESYGSEPTIQHVVGGHSGDGWYVWNDDDAESGSTFLGNNDEVLGKVFAEVATRLHDARTELAEVK